MRICLRVVLLVCWMLRLVGFSMRLMWSVVLGLGVFGVVDGFLVGVLE